MKTCIAPDCNRSFVSKNPRAVYCCRKCFERTRQRRIREERTEKGLCPQCGGQMDFPSSPHGNKENPEYCSECQQYYHRRYTDLKEGAE